jgi:hypothetical protein
MSLAMYAAPFDNDTIEVNNESTIRKRNTNNKTQKRYTNNNSDLYAKDNSYSNKVNSVLKSIHNLPEQEQNDLGDYTPYFNPPPKPMSSGVEQTKLRENQTQMQSPQQNPNLSNNNYNLNLIDNNMKPNTALAENNIENKLKNINMEDYYKRFIPDYQSMYNSTPHTLPYTPPSSNTIENQNTNTIQHQNTNTNFATTDVNKVLLNKLNYMINLLEQDQDEKTQSVMEEVILYCFLGVFIIFICDSFSKVGKYVR